jgi:hypothetical protein
MKADSASHLATNNKNFELWENLTIYVMDNPANNKVSFSNYQTWNIHIFITRRNYLKTKIDTSFSFGKNKDEAYWFIWV